MNWEGFDVETSGRLPEYALQPWRVFQGDAWLTTYATIGSKTRQSVYMPDAEQLRSELLRAINTNTSLVGTNTIFDVSWLLAMGLEDEVFATRWMDMALLWKRVDGRRFTYGLKAAVKKFLPQYAGYDEGTEFHTDTPEGIAELLKYNCKDSAFTLHIAKLMWRELTPSEQRGALIEAKGIPDIAQSWLNGISLDRENLLGLEHSVLKEKLDATFELNHTLCEQGRMEVSEQELNSPAKLRRILFQDWGLAPVKYTGKLDKEGNETPSTDKESLIKLAVEEPMADLVRKVRKASGRLSKFVLSPIESIKYNPEGLTHPQPHIAGTYTGRMTYSSKQGKGKAARQTGIALHQWEREKPIRHSIQAVDGYQMVEFDWSGQEMRIMADRVAAMTGDATMLNLFNNNEDLHSFMGASIKQLDYEKMRATYETDKEMHQGRYLGKFANLSLQYRVGITTMRARALTQYELWLSAQDAEHIKSTYLRTYPGIERYWGAAMNLGRQQGYAETLGGRRIMLHNLRDWDDQQKAINTPIQGTGADMKQLGIAIGSKLWRRMGGLYYFDLHDALFLLLPDNSELLSNALELKNALGNLPYAQAWGWEPLLSLPVDGSVGYRWGDMRGVK